MHLYLAVYGCLIWSKSQFYLNLGLMKLVTLITIVSLFVIMVI